MKWLHAGVERQRPVDGAQRRLDEAPAAPTAQMRLQHVHVGQRTGQPSHRLAQRRARFRVGVQEIEVLGPPDRAHKLRDGARHAVAHQEERERHGSAPAPASVPRVAPEKSGAARPDASSCRPAPPSAVPGRLRAASARATSTSWVLEARSSHQPSAVCTRTPSMSETSAPSAFSRSAPPRSPRTCGCRCRGSATPAC